MNVVRLLLLPWWATPSRAQWWIGVVFGLIAIGFLGALLSSHASLEHNSFGVLIVFNLVAWVALLPNSMVLARDARALRLPALERDALLSLIVYAVLLIVLPGMLVKVAGLSAVQTMLAIGLCAALTMAYACLPSYFSIVIVFAWILTNSTKQFFLTAATRSTFTLWASLALTVLLLALVWGWRRAVRGGYVANSLQAPMVLRFRMNTWKSLQTSNSALVRQQLGWLRPQPDLRRCGPQYPQQSLRIALGGLFLPQRWISRLRTWSWAVLWSALFAAVMALQAWTQHQQAGWILPYHAALLAVLVWSVGFGVAMVALTSLLRLGRVWQSVTGELPLLTLLPGLGARGDLLRAMLLPPLYVQLALLALSLSCALALQLRTVAVSFILLAQLGAFAFVVSFVLLIAGGKLPNKWLVCVFACIGFVLVSTTLGVPTLVHANMIRAATSKLAAGWIGFGVVLAWLGYRGWVGLRERPHPFLPSTL